jgi:peptidoglycan/xylan/chitin deacetylase (PgdA/CDA1 family)
METGLCAGLSAAGAAGLAAGGFAYASLWPASRLFGAGLVAPARPGELALTFDDGPNPAWTPRLLDLLAAAGARATFFMMGSRAAAEPELVRRVVAGGNLIGNHTWSHPNLSRSSAKRIREELKRTQETLEEITGAPARFFRPPFGARRPAVFRIARELGLEPVLWNAMTSDWRQRSAERIAERIAGQIERLERRGRAANIVLHDGNHLERSGDREPSVTAAGLLLKRFRETHRFVTLDAWMVDGDERRGG